MTTEQAPGSGAPEPSPILEQVPVDNWLIALAPDDPRIAPQARTYTQYVWQWQRDGAWVDMFSTPFPTYVAAIACSPFSGRLVRRTITEEVLP